MPDRSDYLEVFRARGPEALTALLQQRYRAPALRARELERMEKAGWLVDWDEETGEGRVAGRAP